MFRLDLNNLVYWLLCLYAFLVPFEHILEIYFGIDTIFKPYRVVALLLIAAFVIRGIRNPTFSTDNQKDIFLYLVYIYGLLISFLYMIFAPFNMGKFYNDLFQTGLYLATFFVLKSTPISRKQWVRLFWFLVVGIVINAAYLFYSYYILMDFRRQAGFMDNPNYVALSLVVAIIFLALRIRVSPRLWSRISYSLLIPFLLFVFVISGSRSGLVILIIGSLFLFFGASLRSKLLIAVLGIGLLFNPLTLDRVDFGAPLVLMERINTLDATSDPRFPLWRGAIRASFESNLLGMGIGQFKANFADYFRNEKNLVIYEVVNRGAHLATHNDYLEVVTDFGLPGLLFYLTFLFISMRQLLGKLNTTRDPWERNIYQLCVIILFCLLIFGMASSNSHKPLYWFLLALVTKV